MISKSLSTSEKFASLTETAGPLAEFCQLLYPLIVAHADDFGRLQGDTFTIKHMCCPISPRTVTDFAAALAHLADAGMIICYEVDGKRYLQIANFEEHQTGLYKRTASKFPELPGTSRKVTEVPDQENLTELNLREENGTKERAAASPRPRPVENPKENVRVITKIVHATLDEGWTTFTDIKEDVKLRCAHAHIAYDADVVGKAIESALAQRRVS